MAIITVRAPDDETAAVSLGDESDAMAGDGAGGEGGGGGGGVADGEDDIVVLGEEGPAEALLGAGEGLFALCPLSRPANETPYQPLVCCHSAIVLSSRQLFLTRDVQQHTFGVYLLGNSYYNVPPVLYAFFSINKCSYDWVIVCNKLH